MPVSNDAAFGAYAARVLAGTGLSPAGAAQIAADPTTAVPPAATAAAAALRDGWRAAAQTGRPA